MDPYVVSRIGAVTIQRVLPETSNQNSDHDASFPPHGVSNDPAETEMGKGGYLSESPKDPTDERMEVDENKQESSETGIKKVSSDSTALEGIRTEFEAPSNGRVETEGAEAVQMQGMETEPTPELGLDMEAQRNVGPRSEDYQMVANEGDKNEFSIPSEGAIDSRTSGGGEEEESGDDSSKLNKADNVISSLTQNNIRNLNSDDINKKLGRFGFSVSVSEVNKPSTQSSPLSDQIQTDADEQEDCGVNEFSDDKGIKSIETLVSSLSEPTNQFQALNSNVELLNELDFKKEIFSDGLDSETVGSEIMDKPNTNGEEEQKMDVRDEDKGAGGAEGDEDEESEDDDDKEGDDDGGDEKDPDDKDGVKKKKKRSKKKKEKKAKKSGKDGDESSSSGSDSDSEKKKRKAGVLNMRRNIREVMDETQLDESTLNAQRQEMERLRRVQEQQRIIREVQRQIAINRQQTKTQTRVISLLQGGSSSKTTVTSSSSSKPNTVVVKVSSGSGSTQIVNKKVLDLLKNQKGSAENASDLKVPAIPRTLNKPHMVTPSVSIAPIQVKSTAVSTSPVEDFSDDENVARAAVALKKKAATGKKDVVTISSSGSEDDCIVISEPSAGEESEVEDDPTNSGMHTNDLYNVPDDQGRVLINVGHPETEPDVFLSPQIARIIKPHQIGGVRFLFDNLVESLERYKTSSGFGCILAHSMGLGKTLQVVSFCDVFLRYTGGKSVLCIMPINTLQNWVAEFNHWLPMDPTNSPLAEDGEVRPRDFQIFILNDFQKSLAARAKVIHEWNKEGGVLMIGYELYRQLSLKKPRKPRNKKQKEEEIPDEKAKPLLEEIYEALVKPGPDLVICDEGHRIKNSHASISHALKQIRSKRRVVLTGYPLQNNLLEYWCMVDFVRPNYLGSKTEFSNMFERPIQNGQCVDSTPQDVRLMRYRAHVLHSLLEGFVQRRSHAVLQQALPQKEEFVLLVRMTDFQRKLYETFMNEVVRVKAVPNPLKAFAVCCKIWNHPDILYNFLKKKEEVDLDLVEAAACIGAPGAVAGSVPPTPPTPTAKGGKRSRAKDPSTAAAKKEKKPRKGSKAAIEAAEKSPAVATVMPNMSNNPTTNDPSMPPFNYNSNSAGPDSNDPFNSNSNYANSNRYDGYGQQPFPGHMGPNYNNPSQQPYNSFNYNQTNYPSQSNLPPSQQPNQQNQQQQSYPYSGYPDQQNYWQDNSNLYPNNPDPNSGMNYYGGSNNSFYNQNNSNFNTPNNLYNQPNYPYGGNDSSSTSGNLPGPNSAATVPPLPNVGNTLGDTNSNLNAFNSKDNSNFSCLSNPPSVPNYNNVSDNVHNIVNNNLGLGNLPDSINPVDSLMNPSLAPNNCEASKNSGNYHGLPCPDYSGNSMYQNMGSSQFTTNSDQNSGNMGSSNMMGSMLNDSAVSTVTNPASSSNLMSDSFNSMTPYGNPQYPGDMYGKSNNYPNSGSFPPHQMNAQQNIPNAQQNMPNAQQNVPNAPQNIPNAQQNASQSMPYNHLAQNQSDFGPPLKKEGDTSMFPNADSSLSGLNYPFKTESKDDIKDPSSFPLLPPSKEELKSEIKDEIKEESKTDVQVKEKEEESVTADDAKKDDLKGESSALVDASMKDASSLTKPSFENPASKKEDPGIPYDWAIKLLEDYVPGAIEASPKMAIFFSIVQDSILMKDRILVFSQSLFTLNLIEDFLQKNFIPGTETYWAKNWSYYRLDGSTTASEREKLINEFNANDQVHMFLVSTRAGSLGINLVGANRVIVFDASWNPCHDTQAVCRVYRYGQQKPCFVYRLVMDNCLEKKIYDRQINKQGMADRVVDECNPDAHLSIKEVANLCWDNDEDSAVQDFSDCKDKYTDVIIHRILDSFSQFLSKAPFEHESLLVDRKEKKLSTAEKRLAKRSYELEKQANTRPTYNFVGNQQGLQIRSLNKPMASVRPVQSEMNSFGKDSNSKWIPAEVWQKQGMSAQEMTLPLDVVIPTNSADRSSIVLNAGQKVMVLKSPKGIYMQLENGKIIAIRTAYKVGAGGGANKGTEKKMFTGQTQSRQVPLNRPQFDRGVRGLEGRREISVSPIRGRGTAVPGLLRNNSSISITPRTIPAARNVSPNSKPNGSLMRLLGPKSRTTNVRLPVIKDSNVSVTITKRNPAVSSASSSSSSFSTPPSAEQLERDSSYHSRLESKTKQMESASGQKVMNADFSDNLSQSPSSNSSSSLLNQPVEKDVKSVGTESNPSDFKESLNTSTSTNTSSSPDSMYSDPARFASDAKSGDYKQTDKMYSEPMRPRIDIKSPEYKQPEKAYHEPTRPRIDMKTHDYKHTSEHVRHKIDIRSPEFNKADQSRLMMDLSPSDYKQMDKMYNEPMRPKVDIKSPEYKQMDRSYNEPMRPRLEMKSSEYKQADKPFNEPMRLKADPKTSDYKPLDKMKNLMYSQNQATFTPAAPISDRLPMPQSGDKSKFPSLPPNISFGPANSSQKNYRPTSHQRSSTPMNSSYHGDANRMPEMPVETSSNFKKPNTSPFNPSGFSSSVSSDLQQMPQQFKNTPPYQSLEKTSHTKDSAFQNLKQRGSISIIPMDKSSKAQQSSLHPPSQSPMSGSSTNSASQIPLNSNEYDYRSNIDSGVEPFSSPAYRSDYYSNFSQQPVSSAPSPSPQMHSIYSNPTERSGAQSLPSSYDMYQQPYSAAPNVGSSGYSSSSYNSASYESPVVNQQMNQQQMYSAFHRPEPLYPAAPAPAPTSSYPNPPNPYQYNSYYPPYGSPASDNSNLQNLQRPQ